MGKDAIYFVAKIVHSLFLYFMRAHVAHIVGFDSIGPI